MIIFELAGRGDVDAIMRLLHDDVIGSTRESTDPAPYLRVFDEIDRDPNNFVIVGREEDRVISTVQLTVIPTMSRQGIKRGQLESVRVDSSRRGMGIGKAMVLWAISFAWEVGCGLVQLTADKTRTESIAFYESMGFRNTHDGLKLMKPADD